MKNLESSNHAKSLISFVWLPLRTTLHVVSLPILELSLLHYVDILTNLKSVLCTTSRIRPVAYKRARLWNCNTANMRHGSSNMQTRDRDPMWSRIYMEDKVRYHIGSSCNKEYKIKIYSNYYNGYWHIMFVKIPRVAWCNTEEWKLNILFTKYMIKNST